ncbi:heparan-alpha-glucosaminide N-acetyltransferase domain-containing protein [Nocardioides perillae]|uniref:Putative membrane protein n=1 Tax=Nocardioides perillae TaxID=1119534 RepID=A0A7Y9RW29_9ACTN|nr:putative membrane protein [Nocardioides perillae]
MAGTGRGTERGRRHDRVVGVDVARCAALLGMVATHVLDERAPTGELTLAHEVAGGRASALFAVLAGVSLALLTGGPRPVVGRERAARSAGLVVRALLVALIGLLLGMLDTGIAVILTYYGVVFLLALPFLGLRTRSLLVAAGAWAVLAPLASHLLRPSLPPRGYASPTLEQLADPGQLLSELLWTGYYPAVPWLSYALLGLAVGRLDLRSWRAVGTLVAGGAVLAGLAHAVSGWLTAQPGVLRALLRDPSYAAPDGPTLEQELASGMFGTTPTGGPVQWLLVDAPHSATPFDLAATGGTALLVLGLALVVDRLPGAVRRAAAVLFGAGAATLTLYSLHLVMKTPDVPPAEVPGSFATHVGVLLAVGAVLALSGQSGLLERVVTAASRGTAALVRGRGR